MGPEIRAATLRFGSHHPHPQEYVKSEEINTRKVVRVYKAHSRCSINHSSY